MTFITTGRSASFLVFWACALYFLRPDTFYCHRPQFTSGFVSFCEIGARLGHVRLGAGAKSADKALRASQIFVVVKPFELLRLDHDKVRNEFDAYCLVQHQVPRL